MARKVRDFARNKNVRQVLVAVEQGFDIKIELRYGNHRVHNAIPPWRTAASTAMPAALSLENSG